MAHEYGATNALPSFVQSDGPVREALFKTHPEGGADGGVHGLFTVTMRRDADPDAARRNRLYRQSTTPRSSQQAPPSRRRRLTRRPWAREPRAESGVGPRDLCLTDLARRLGATCDRDLAGHRQTETTLWYIHLSGGDLAVRLARGMAQMHVGRSRVGRSACGRTISPGAGAPTWIGRTAPRSPSKSPASARVRPGSARRLSAGRPGLARDRAAAATAGGRPGGTRGTGSALYRRAAKNAVGLVMWTVPRPVRPSGSRRQRHG